MANKINLAFFNAYLELDKICAKRFDISKKGVTAYISKLVDLRYAPERNEVLRKLIKYRKLRNIIAHEVDAMSDLNEITKEDIKWINKFSKNIEGKKDPISRYERKIRRQEIWRKVRVVLIILGIIAAIVAGFVIFNILK